MTDDRNPLGCPECLQHDCIESVDTERVYSRVEIYGPEGAPMIHGGENMHREHVHHECYYCVNCGENFDDPIRVNEKGEGRR